MTTYEHLMLACCFGVSAGFLIASFGMMMADFIRFIKKKIKAHKDKKAEKSE